MIAIDLFTLMIVRDRSNSIRSQTSSTDTALHSGLQQYCHLGSSSAWADANARLQMLGAEPTALPCARALPALCPYRLLSYPIYVLDMPNKRSATKWVAYPPCRRRLPPSAYPDDWRRLRTAADRRAATSPSFESLYALRPTPYALRMGRARLGPRTSPDLCLKTS